MKVLFLTSWYPRPEEPVAAMWMRELVHRIKGKANVAVLFVRHGGRRLSVRDKKYRPLFTTVMDDEGVPTVYVRGRGWVPREWMAWAGFRKLHRVWGKPDVVHAHVAYPAGHLAARYARKARTPYVLTEHYTEFGRFRQSARRWRRVRTALLSADVVTAPSRALGGEIRESFPGLSVAHVPNMVDDALFRPAPNPPCPPGKMLTLCYMRREKGLHVLMEALSLLLQRGGLPPFQMEFAGEGPERASLQAQSRTLGLETTCVFTGFHDRVAAARAMRRCHFFVLPSLRETFSIVTVEALACGKPVVATACGGPEEILTEATGLIVPPGDAKALADAMATMLRTFDHYDTEAVRRHAVGRYGAEAVVGKWMEMYTSMLERRPPVPCG